MVTLQTAQVQNSIMDELTVTVVGCMKSTDYHKAKCIVEV